MFDFESDDPSFQLTNGRYPASGRANRQRVAGEILREHLSISPTRMSRLVEIKFTSPDPAFSARVANTWSENFIQTNLERKIQRSEEHTSELQSLMRISYAVFCLKKKKKKTNITYFHVRNHNN